jgi:uncharacterized surface protein with fasciclin (FAS1) repeats
MLNSFLSFHVINGTFLVKKLEGTLDGRNVKSINGVELAFSVSADGLKVNSAKVTTTDIVADNGVIHFIDTVLFNPTPLFPAASSSKFKEAG